MKKHKQLTQTKTIKSKLIKNRNQ